MTTDSPWIFIILPIGLIVIVAVLIANYIAAQKRQEALHLFAMQLGFEFRQNDPFSIPYAYSFKLLERGHDQRIENVLYGQFRNRSIKAFDYRYTTGSGKNQSTHRLTAVVLDTDAPLKPLVIRHESMFDRLAKVIGFDDIDFESEEFSRKFFVKSPDRKFAYDVIHTRMMGYLIANPGWNIEILGRSIVVYNDLLLDPIKIKSAMDFICGFVDLFPDYLWKTLRSV